MQAENWAIALVTSLVLYLPTSLTDSVVGVGKKFSILCDVYYVRRSVLMIDTVLTLSVSGPVALEVCNLPLQRRTGGRG